ncbi:MAG TPA: NAD(P)H-hydrate dehydratase [Terriglobia bacterium]|nr:NAD(P)H-hydrate dehydratase [Terriglobia bacterium]
MKILTAAQMQRVDRLTAERYGLPSLTLMENAGRRVVEFLDERYAPLRQHTIAVLCGRGNNGGDGFVVARLLRERGLKPRLVLLADPAAVKGDAAAELNRLAESGALEVAADSAVWQRLLPSLHGVTLLIDAILGTGLARPLDGFLLEVVHHVNALSPRPCVVAVDLPSGISADTGDLIGEYVRADASVTFTAPKIAHVFPPACEAVGEWVVRPIGTPPEALEGDPDLFLSLTRQENLAWLAEPRKPYAHKGNFGHVLILAGSVGKTGAAALAAKAASRAGAGLVTVATPKSALATVAALGMEFMTEPLPETDSGTVSLRALENGRLDDLLAGKTVLAVGPGLGASAETAELVRAVANRYELPLVLDADGLNAFAGRMAGLRAEGRIRVLTPHPGEMARLLGPPASEIQAHRVEVAREFATRFQVYLVLKGSRTLIASPDGQVRVNPTGNPGMATGGTGDVLTGLIAGLMAQFASRPVAEVVAAAVYVHGLAGDLAAREFGEAPMIAGDLLDAIPRAFKAVTSVRP